MVLLLFRSLKLLPFMQDEQFKGFKSYFWGRGLSFGLVVLNPITRSLTVHFNASERHGQGDVLACAIRERRLEIIAMR